MVARNVFIESFGVAVLGGFLFYQVLILINGKFVDSKSKLISCTVSRKVANTSGRSSHYYLFTSFCTSRFYESVEVRGDMALNDFKNYRTGF
jgi:hypothetical protein